VNISAFPRFALLAVALQTAGPQMRTPAQLFEGGQTFDQFLHTVGTQRELWRRNTAQARVPRDLLERLTHVSDSLRVLIVAEDWCPDSVNTVPYVAQLAAAAAIDLRVVRRAEGEPVMALHRTPDGRTATPTIVLLRDGRDVGAWVERPAILQHLFLSMATNPEHVQSMANRQAWYDSDGGVTTLTEVVTLAERTLAKR
jgi:hypothetical protein